MERDINNALIEWRNSPVHLPIMLRGARQVGKSYTVEQFGKQHFKQLIVVNFEQNPEFKKCFESLEPKAITHLIELQLGVDITPGETLLFLDEIQECPNAIMALRYFKEQMSSLHVIAAGSLLEFVLDDENFRMPVGRVQFFHIKPLSFKEFLVAKGHKKLREFIETFTWNDTINEMIHEKMLDLMREYMVLGGMPAVVDAYLKGESFKAAQNIQSILLTTYENDFGKYSKGIGTEHLKLLFRRLPDLITQQFKYTKVAADIQSREIKAALQKLVQANIVHQVYSTTANGLPLNALINTKKFKLLFLDVGLIERKFHLDAEILMKKDLFLVNRGALVEQFVGQELLVYQDILLPPEVYFWARDKKNSSAEVDYVININENIIPIEVKAGAHGRLRSMHVFLEEHASELGVRISQLPPNKSNSIIDLPFYMVSEIARLVKAL